MAMMSGRRNPRVLAVWLGTWIGLVAAGSAVHAQDAHYWTLSYGTRATLLGGAVIGSTSDLSATFYNPAAIALLRERGFILSAKVYEYNSLRVEDGGGEGIDLVSGGTSPLPSFVAGAFKIGRLEHHSFAYSVLTRQSSHLQTTTRLVEDRDVLASFPGDESFAAEFNFQQDLGDLWAGLSWAYPLAENVGVGVTQYFAFRDQHTRGELTGEALPRPVGELASVNLIRDFNFLDVRVLWKAGLGLRHPPLTLGLTATTPGVHLYGSGSTFTNTTVTGLDTSGDSVPDPVMAAQHLESVDADYRSPWSAGFGGSYQFGDTVLHASAEWFEAIPFYDVMDTTPYTGQTSGNTLRFPVTQELKGVFNYGFGVEQRYTKWSGYASFVTDLSARIPGSDANVSFASWDLHHISGGASFSVGRVDMVLGGTYSYGSEDVRQITDWLGQDPSTPLEDGVRDAKVRTRSYRVLFGFSIGS